MAACLVFPPVLRVRIAHRLLVLAESERHGRHELAELGVGVPRAIRSLRDGLLRLGDLKVDALQLGCEVTNLAVDDFLMISTIIAFNVLGRYHRHGKVV